MEYKRLTRSEANECVDRMNTDSLYYSEHIGEITNPKVDSDYDYFHDRLLKCYEKSKRDSNGVSKPSYYKDLKMAEEVYRVFEAHEFTLRDATDDEIWLYFNL